jgi:hypothetical protein
MTGYQTCLFDSTAKGPKIVIKKVEFAASTQKNKNPPPLASADVTQYVKSKYVELGGGEET